MTTGREFRGGERQVVFLHEGLLAANIQSILLFRKKSVLENMPIPCAQSHNLTGFPNILGFIRFMWQCHNLNPEIIHAHDSHAFTFASLVAFLLKKKILVTKRTVFTVKNTLFNRWKYSRCNGIIAISQAVKNKYRNLALHPKITIIPDCYGNHQHLYSRAKSRELLGIDEPIIAIGTVGYFTEEKNIPLLFFLAESLIDSFPQVAILCVGVLGRDLQKQADQYENLITTGLIDNALRIYRAFDLYVSTSTKEGLGSALLDAVALDLPAFALDSYGGRDILTDYSPFLIPQNQPEILISRVKECLTQYEKYTQLARIEGKRVRELFSPSKVIGQYQEIYDKLACK